MLFLFGGVQIPTHPLTETGAERRPPQHTHTHTHRQLHSVGWRHSPTHTRTAQGKPLAEGSPEAPQGQKGGGGGGEGRQLLSPRSRCVCGGRGGGWGGGGVSDTEKSKVTNRLPRATENTAAPQRDALTPSRGGPPPPSPSPPIALTHSQSPALGPVPLTDNLLQLVVILVDGPGQRAGLLGHGRAVPAARPPSGGGEAPHEQRSAALSRAARPLRIRPRTKRCRPRLLQPRRLLLHRRLPLPPAKLCLLSPPAHAQSALTSPAPAATRARPQRLWGAARRHLERGTSPPPPKVSESVGRVAIALSHRRYSERGSCSGVQRAGRGKRLIKRRKGRVGMPHTRWRPLAPSPSLEERREESVA